MVATNTFKYTDPAKLAADIDAYFAKCDARTVKKLTKDGELVEVPEPEVYTVAGLAVHLKMTRKCLLDYHKREKFAYIVSLAKTRIEAQVVQRSMTTQYATGCIFNLKTNFGYVETQNINLGGQSGNPIETKQITEQDQEIIKKFIETKKSEAEKK